MGLQHHKLPRGVVYGVLGEFSFWSLILTTRAMCHIDVTYVRDN